jgi:hypothetical protein
VANKKPLKTNPEQEFSILSTPFKRDAIYDALHLYPLSSRPNREKAWDFFEKTLGMDEKMQLKYLLHLIYLGKELQEIQKECNRFQIIQVPRLIKIANPWDHPAAKTLPKTDLKAKVLDLEAFLIWQTILQDLLLILKTHIADFISTYQLRLLSGFDPESPNQ